MVLLSLALLACSGEAPDPPVEGPVVEGTAAAPAEAEVPDEGGDTPPGAELRQADLVALCRAIGSCAAEDCSRPDLAERLAAVPVSGQTAELRDALAGAATTDFDPVAHELAQAIEQAGVIQDTDCALIHALWWKI